VTALEVDKVDRYLARLGIEGRPAPTIANLRLLQRAHLRRIPFENASILRGEPLPIDVPSLAEKILDRGRGGFCYELNGLFAALLESLGFDVKLRGSRVFIDGDSLGPPLDHLCLEVTIDGEPWLADVGFGYSFLEPLRFRTGIEQEDPMGRFRLVDAPDGAIDVEWLHRGGRWRGHYRIDPGTHDLADFAAMCEYQRTSPDSHFHTGWALSRATDLGFVTITGRQYVASERGEVVEKRTIDDDAELARLVDRWVGLSL
jgi:N-hydroxyarylamine O-acetyltransferase